MKHNFELGPGDWEALRELLQAALEMEPENRSEWIESLGPEKDDFKPRLRALLSHAGNSSSAAILDTPPKFGPEPLAAAGELDGRRNGDLVGPYRLLRILGQGGMGNVWLAERDDMLQRRQVALKLPRVMTDRAQLAERLAREREILAGLNHPNIARLYDAGIAADSQPYLALEYVEGECIDVYCSRKQLDMSDRLRLFLQVVRAIAYAHASLVVHRDLKPGNMMVTDTGEVRLLDFGIAKLLEHGSSKETQFTRMTGRVLTPDYAAPEQISGKTVTTAADVYALGVVLFELLTGVRPYRLKRDSQAALEEAIVQSEVVRPSTAVTVPALRRRLRGDLDTIVLKALKKEPSERYATANALAEDIERYLARQPVLAQPDKRSYRLRKFIARNRLAVAAASSVFIAILAGSGVSIWQAREARIGQQRAEEVKNFIESIFRDADPFSSGAEPTVKGLLKQAEDRLIGRFARQPSLRVELLTTLASAYIGINEFESAENLLNEAVGIGKSELGPLDGLTLRARIAMTTVYRFRGQLAEMQAALEAIQTDLQSADTVFPADRLLAAENSAHLAIDQGRFTDAEAAARDAQRIALQYFDEYSEQAANTAMLVAVALTFGPNPESAPEASRHALDLALKVHGAERPHARVLDARAILGKSLGNAGRYQEGAVELKQVVEEAAQLLGPDTAMIGFYSADIARFLLETGDLHGSLSYSQRSLQVLSALVDADTYTLAAAHYNVGRAQLALRQTESALQSFLAARYGMTEARGRDSAVVRNATAHVAQTLALQGNIAEAESEIEPEIDFFRDASGLLKFHGLHVAGILKRISGQWAAADELQRAARAAISDGDIDARRRALVETEFLLISVDQGDFEAAVRRVNAWSRTLSEAPPVTPDDADRLLAVGRAYLGAGRPDMAIAPLRAVDSYWRDFDAQSHWARDSAYWLSECERVLEQVLRPRADAP